MITIQEPRIELLPAKLLVGMKLQTNFVTNRIPELWQTFMPRRQQITNRTNADLISMAVYPSTYSFSNFNPAAMFEKWAAAEVTEVDKLPDGFEMCTLPAGLYAVFHYRGLNTDTAIYQHIFGQWLPASEYRLDTRPHFEILGSLYRNNHPDSEEDIYVPVIR